MLLQRMVSDLLCFLCVLIILLMFMFFVLLKNQIKSRDWKRIASNKISDPRDVVPSGDQYL